MSINRVDVTRAVQNSGLSNFQRRTILLCIGLGLADGFNSLSVGYVIPGLADKWDVPLGSFAWVVVSAVIGEILASTMLAPRADRFGRRTMIAVGIVTFGFATLAAAFAPNVWVLALCRFFAGVGIGTTSPNLFALSTDYSPNRYKSTVVTVLGGGMALGGTLCGIVAGVVVPRFGGEALFLVAGAVPLIVLALAIRATPESLEIYVARGDRQRVAQVMNQIEGGNRYTAKDDFSVPSDESIVRPGLSELFRGGRAVSSVLVWAMFFLGISGSYFVFSWLTSILTLGGISEASAIFASSVTIFGGIVGGIVLGVLLDRSRFGILSLLVGTIVQTTATVVLASALSPTLGQTPLVVLCLVLGFGIVGTGTALTAVTARTYPPQLRSTGLGWATGFSRLGAIFAPMVGGQLIDGGWSSSAILYVSLIPSTVNALLFCIFHRYGRFAPSESDRELDGKLLEPEERLHPDTDANSTVRSTREGTII
ncbi:MFS transporter [Rhodococcus qingshengii]|uniref:MFS transporter n=1 Tax=Rhodococcus qingshengii TaxID=334542 RepID=UPI001BE6E3C6|nr:MFS transporter [Rhodococcus qingshengii]MBT2272274.1 MFS transporter [Rhodococcus qingshengii]